MIEGGFNCPLFTDHCSLCGAHNGDFKSEEDGEGPVAGQGAGDLDDGDYRHVHKLTVAKDLQLRKVIREAGGKYRVVKNKLAAISG